MDREEFIRRCRGALVGKIPDDELDEIIADYNEHFTIGILNGRDEDELSAALGDPVELAKEWRAIILVKKAEEHLSLKNVGHAVLATIGLGLFNVLVVLIPAIILFGILLFLLISGIGFVIGGITMAVMAIVNLAGLVTMIEMNIPLAVLFTGIGCVSLGFLIVIADGYLTKWIYALLIRYLNWNVSVILGKDKI